jgi:hypothetical protein
MGLRAKILSGFLILSVMLFTAGVWSIYEINSMGTSVQQLLEDNYKSINAAKTMLEALERQDSGILLLISGKWSEGRRIVTSGDSLFQVGFVIARDNLTIPGEKRHIEVIDSTYGEYKKRWEKPIVGTEKEGNVNWYLESIHASFLHAKAAVDDLMSLNDRAMFQTASELESKANRAIMPGIVAIISALIFSLIFSYFVNYYMVSPIVKITENIRRFVDDRRLPFNVEIETRDELSNLASSIKTLSALVKTPDV